MNDQISIVDRPMENAMTDAIKACLAADLVSQGGRLPYSEEGRERVTELIRQLLHLAEGQGWVESFRLHVDDQAVFPSVEVRFPQEEKFRALRFVIDPLDE